MNKFEVGRYSYSHFKSIVELGHSVAAGVMGEVLSQAPVHGQRQGFFLGNSVLRIHAECIFIRQVGVDCNRLGSLGEVGVVGVLLGAEDLLLVEAHIFVELVEVDQAAPLGLVKLADLVHR